jgi:hypothetical protein
MCFISNEDNLKQYKHNRENTIYRVDSSVYQKV